MLIGLPAGKRVPRGQKSKNVRNTKQNQSFLHVFRENVMIFYFSFCVFQTKKREKNALFTENKLCNNCYNCNIANTCSEAAGSGHLARAIFPNGSRKR